jgi:hypothetical protein
MSIMDEETLTLLETKVVDLLQKYPQTNRFFITQKTACVGCYMARFCSLEDVISTYEIDKATFFVELKKVIKNPNQI